MNNASACKEEPRHLVYVRVCQQLHHHYVHLMLLLLLLLLWRHLSTAG
jgi:hypothetical protein